MTKQKHLNQRNNKKIKKQNLTRLSSIMKGLVIYKTETDELWRLIEKYPEQVSRLNVAYAQEIQ